MTLVCWMEPEPNLLQDAPELHALLITMVYGCAIPPHTHENWGFPCKRPFDGLSESRHVARAALSASHVPELVRPQ